MTIPIVCENADCANNGMEINTVSGILPPDLNRFYEGYSDSEAEDRCPICKVLGVPQDAVFEHEAEKRYYD